MSVYKTIKIMKLRKKQAYLKGIIDGMEELEKHLNDTYLKDTKKDEDFGVMVYRANDELQSHYFYHLDVVETEIEELLEKDK
tara:strand:+ start:6985 stop:7230 length:246 start_codon:yes stop_codon:yes gene_type:complete